MASGSSVGRANISGSKGNFDLASDDILCSYEEFDDHQDPSNGNHSDPVVGTNSIKDFQKNRVSRSSVLPPTNIYTNPDVSLNQEVMATIENTMKRYTDNLTRFLEGISSRLSQLELYCYNLDKSIGEMRSELAHDNKEADSKLKCLDKHLQEVHRSVQILRDKQELAETQKELAKLQLAHKESSRPQQEEKSAKPDTESKKSEDGPEMRNQQLALPMPHQVAEQQQQPVSIAASSQTTSQNISQQPPYYLPATQLPNPAAQPQPPHCPYPSADPHYLASQQNQVSQPLQVQQYAQYQQQWPQPPVQPTQPQIVQSQTQIRAPPSVYPTYIQNQPPQMLTPGPPQQELVQSQTQIKPPPSVYPTYIQNQPLNPPPKMQMPTPGAAQQAVSQPDAVQYGYGGPGRPHQTQPPPQPMKGGSYMMYSGPHHPPQAQTQFPLGYQPANTPRPPASGGHMMRGGSPPQFVRNHPYNELIDKLVSMGYRGDHVASVIQRIEETGQPVDFNSVLDRLNGHSSGGSQRSW